MSFKEQLKDDLSEVFFNIDEFAEMHTLGGQEVPLIIDDDELQKRRIKAAEGTYVGDMLLLVETKHINKKPVEGKKLTLDGKPYFVISCEEKEGLYEIAIGANESW